jgi:hypothetical protein
MLWQRLASPQTHLESAEAVPTLLPANDTDDTRAKDDGLS